MSNPIISPQIAVVRFFTLCNEKFTVILRICPYLPIFLLLRLEFSRQLFEEVIAEHDRNAHEQFGVDGASAENVVDIDAMTVELPREP